MLILGEAGLFLVSGWSVTLGSVMVRLAEER